MAFSAAANTILLAIPVRIEAFYGQLIRSFERYASSYGYRIVSTTIGHMSARNVGPDFEYILQYPLSGIVLVDLPVAFQPEIKALCPPGAPIVSVGAFTMDSLDTVSIHLENGVTEAVNTLIQSGRRRIAFFGPGINDEMSVLETFAANNRIETRVAIYSELMTKANHQIEVIPGNPGSRRESAKALNQYISENDCPDAIFAFNDEMAITANCVLRDLGIRVPEDTLLVGCDGLEELEDLTPTLSSVHQPFTQLSARTIELLERRINGPDCPLQHLDIHAHFVPRQSTGS